MYSGDRSGSTELEQPRTPEDGMPEVEEGQALEVIELANGETIWSVPLCFFISLMFISFFQVNREWLTRRGH